LSQAAKFKATKMPENYEYAIDEQSGLNDITRSSED
jgi:hypothetical protein